VARILDLGCGKGNLPVRAGVTASDEVVGLDINRQALAIARERFPERSFCVGVGERLPFANGAFDRIVSGVALPYMNISAVLAETRRVLIPGGSVFLSLHPLRFTIRELREALPRPIPSLFRLFVILNGIVLHLTGCSLSVRGRPESFQTQRSMRRALTRAGFEQIQFSRPDGRLLVQAVLSSQSSPVRAPQLSSSYGPMNTR
jgi:ubiquinone/menaquinone biosynthesis C-methylase UbiE